MYVGANWNNDTQLYYTTGSIHINYSHILVQKLATTKDPRNIAANNKTNY